MNEATTPADGRGDLSAGIEARDVADGAIDAGAQPAGLTPGGRSQAGILAGDGVVVTVR